MRSNGAVNRHLFQILIPKSVVALILLAHIPERIQGPSLVEFIERDDIRKIQHIDLLQLGGCSVFRRHDIERKITVVEDLCIALTNAGSFQNDQIEAGGLEDLHCFLYIFRKGQIALTGGQ